ncbi:23S rRNA (uridine(2552)-2'-O)-methyltransferase [Halocatena salina]|uniref:Ribosomal RNA large subunit methyltransferase E n=1 Tax=Halocatena salina TaxID=2934340 RepID=A0A8U0A217_9EURY|nr:23S rRNA (uridine(2552)-2'-O)-methyltransferase [Halocatena salina]UPM43221.1 23S rRNA (uridine(2552)-2'-O)-methyltransferase [Halocatena salina]
MSHRDQYYNKAKQEGYRSRAAYKLKQLDEATTLLNESATVVDLGAAPGGWLQVATERVGEEGTVVGVDRQRIDPIDGVQTIRGDMTDDETRERVADRIEESTGDGVADVVLSDMAPNMTGEYSLDHARSIHLARQAFDTAMAVLAPGGDFVVKVFDGSDLAAFRAEIESEFKYVRAVHPDASRDESSELYLVGKGHITVPLEAGVETTVEIVDTGHEGDGIAKVDGYTLFVPDTEAGETVRVVVTDVKPNFGFAERIE